MHPQSFTVDRNQQGARLGDVLASRWPAVRRPFLRRLVRDGLVRVNRVEANGHQRMRAGDEVMVALPPGVETMPVVVSDSRAAGGFTVLAEDAYALVIDKPAGLITVPGRDGIERGVHGRLGSAFDGVDVRIAHRLDRETSGCLALAKGAEGARHLDEAFSTGSVTKLYLALVAGRFARQRAVVDRALGPDPRRPGRVKVVPAGAKRSRPARSEIEVAERFRGFTLLRVMPRTGRGHQVRVHLQSLGHPIVGDPDYGGVRPLLLSQIKRGYKQRRGVVEQPLLARMFLHAAELALPGADGGELVARSPLPADLSLVLGKLRRFAAEEDETCD